MDEELSKVRQLFCTVSDRRARNRVYNLPDVLMSGYAMFSLKYSSLLDFEQQTKVERENLRQVFGIEQICSDVQMRRILDVQDPDFIRQSFSDRFKELKNVGLLQEYSYKIGVQSYLIVSCDGVQHFSSKSLSCPCCLKKEHRDGSRTYHHNMLCAALVHPDKREVFLLQTEPIIQQDGEEKNDCERNAAKRLQSNIYKDYEVFQAQYRAQYRFLFVEDALYANVPHLQQLEGNGYSYVLNVKPDSHKTLFAQVAGKKQRNQLKTHVFAQNGVTHRFEWVNNLVLCNANPSLRVNFLSYQKTEKNGKSTTFTWITNISLDKNKVWAVMRAGRARWKIENETFNTLKNLGYRFEHNFGHGNDHLSVMFAYLMMLAFYVDQFVQACSRTFQCIEQGILTKIKLWNTIKSLFQTTLVLSMNDIYSRIADLFDIQLE